MKIFSCAKINLYLDVVGRDTDGYHFIESLFQEVSLADEIEVNPSESDFISFDGMLVEGDTTVHKALRLFRESFGTKSGYTIHVKKRIPMGAGLGGGSSNAAAVLSALAVLEGVEKASLFPLASRIGSDVPFFLWGGMAWVSGKGEKITPLSCRLEDVYFLIVYPGIHVSTAWAYSLINDYRPHTHPQNILDSLGGSLDFLRKIVYNKFQPFVFAAREDLARWKAILDRESGAEFSFMSGSGSSLVYVYSSAERRDADRKCFSYQRDIQVFSADPVYRPSEKG
ncbi:4-(cytidine 5'-diphospho)-2-C-methyl-D-erythritol kinase [Thermospira aquatica]|uniref:4-diphosphocytidyl-2-C-methyl-D-erythritol kinase n=1 Tax=Thermospira aquatica TaxID=2828656 RepID=A0AAX3BET4_9SPIR|nr:4-(cytidine 5'-diphospho)-2-C-methyl-D-erythritol kinase [Thermospira aquatica]URA10216.1 4-(cytidine 5'-diphospho)-2-C-methyl-D-erythritol kinase [Thermospira aquatica]